ncbi:MAG: rRNA maturation RNase YbeY [Verrucomicrobia bacterium]|nr:rRNA maturation RNase YbeY [Verrucomicrobiota bacterium]
MPKPKPTLHWSNRQRRYRLNLAFFRRRTELALARLPADRIGRLPSSLEFVFVGASESSRLHLRFSGDPTPADVLAFPHGEIIVCPAVAAALCKGHRLSFQDELLTYLLHGILHLVGFRDSTRAGAQSMRRMQTRLRKSSKERRD